MQQHMDNLMMEAAKASMISNALMWKHGYTNRQDVLKVHDEYFAMKQAELAGKKAEGSVHVVENFIDPSILQQATIIDDSTPDDDSTVYFDEPAGSAE